jgi:2'-5' RNA ligase
VADTAVVACVPEADPAIREWRLRHTRDGAAEMPAHVTLVYPFADTAEVTEALLGKLGALVADFEAIELVLRETARFGGDSPTLWLRPEPSEPFVALTEALVRAFPEFPPYRGAFDEIVPHLTIARGDDALLERIEAELAPTLPIHADVREVSLFEHVRGRWRKRVSFSLSRHKAAGHP